jgi:hypothetical protein
VLYYCFTALLFWSSLLTTLWLEYDAPTIALGIAWLTAKFYDFAPATGALKKKKGRRH